MARVHGFLAEYLFDVLIYQEGNAIVLEDYVISLNSSVKNHYRSHLDDKMSESSFMVL